MIQDDIIENRLIGWSATARVIVLGSPLVKVVLAKTNDGNSPHPKTHNYELSATIGGTGCHEEVIGAGDPII